MTLADIGRLEQSFDRSIIESGETPFMALLLGFHIAKLVPAFSEEILDTLDREDDSAPKEEVEARIVGLVEEFRRAMVLTVGGN